MTKITNNPKTSDPIIDVNRAQIEHRATWMALIFDEAEKVGLDAEKITRAAIRRCGHLHGNFFREKCEAPVNCETFGKVFPPPIAIQTFEMDNIQAAPQELNIEFHYCPLVAAWQKLGFDDDRCALLCDLAMEGDRGIAEAMGVKLDLTDRIAEGCPTCKLRFYL